MTTDTQKKVLLIEAEDSLAQAMDRVITGEGHACARLAPGDRIAHRVSQDRPDLILLDVTQANRAEALDACQTIRRDPSMGDVKILMLQGSASPLDRRRGKAMGANGTVAMPLRIDELRSEMRRLLGDASVH